MYIPDYTPISHRGRFNSIFPIIRKLGFTLGPFLIGIYIKFFSVKAVCPIIFVLSLLAAVFMYLLYRSENEKS